MAHDKASPKITTETNVFYWLEHPLLKGRKALVAPHNNGLYVSDDGGPITVPWSRILQLVENIKREKALEVVGQL